MIQIALSLRLACDASAYGVGAVISHLMADGSEKLTAFASRTLTQAEHNYSWLEKGTLSIIFALVSILYPRKGTSPLEAARLQ